MSFLIQRDSQGVSARYCSSLQQKILIQRNFYRIECFWRIPISGGHGLSALFRRSGHQRSAHLRAGILLFTELKISGVRYVYFFHFKLFSITDVAGQYFCRINYIGQIRCQDSISGRQIPASLKKQCCSCTQKHQKSKDIRGGAKKWLRRLGSNQEPSG